MKMSDKSVKGGGGREGASSGGTGSGAGGGADGDGGGGGGVASGSEAPSAESITNARGSDLHWLLPHIAEAIETLDGATAQELQRKIEELTSIKYSRNDLTSGLENGTQLGLFEVTREYSLNREYLNSAFTSESQRELVSFVKSRLREEGLAARNTASAGAKKKSRGYRKHPMMATPGRRRKTCRKMCYRCKKQVTVIADNRSDAGSYSSGSVPSVRSEKSKTKTTGKRNARQRESQSKRKKLSPSPQDSVQRSGQPQSDNAKKSKLLVETNLLKKEPPNLMFT